MINETGPISGGAGLTEQQSDPRSAGVDYSMHALWTAVKTFRGASTQAGLVTVSVQPRNDSISDLLN